MELWIIQVYEYKGIDDQHYLPDKRLYSVAKNFDEAKASVLNILAQHHPTSEFRIHGGLLVANETTIALGNNILNRLVMPLNKE